MVPYASIIGMFLSMALYVGAMVVVFLYFQRKSKIVETGYLSACGLGIAAYFWAMVLFMIGSVGVIDSLIGQIKNLSYVFQISLVPLLATFFTTLGLVWSAWLTNGKTASFYRGIAVGLGFSLAETTLYYLIPSVSNVRHAMEINNGTFHSIMENGQASAQTIQSIYDNLVETHPIIYFLGGIERVTLTAIYISILVILTKHMKEKALWKGILQTAALYLVYIVGVTILGELPKSTWGTNVPEMAWSVLQFAYKLGIAVGYLFMAKPIYDKNEKLADVT